MICSHFLCSLLRFCKYHRHRVGKDSLVAGCPRSVGIFSDCADTTQYTRDCRGLTRVFCPILFITWIKSIGCTNMIGYRMRKASGRGSTRLVGAISTAASAYFLTFDRSMWMIWYTRKESTCTDPLKCRALSTRPTTDWKNDTIRTILPYRHLKCLNHRKVPPSQARVSDSMTRIWWL
jgi:hypothetical protein